MAYSYAYDKYNMDENGRYISRENRVTPLYKQLKYKSSSYIEPIGYANAFIHPEDKDTEWLEDLKHEHFEF